MAIGDLFKSAGEREKDAKQKRRKAFREAEKSKDAVTDRVKKMKKERDASWLEARRYLGEGQKAAAQRCLQTVRASEMMMSKLEQKRWVFEQLLTKLEMSKTDQDFAQALGAINTVVKIDPDAVEDVLGEVEDKLGDQVDIDKLWEKQNEKEMDGVQNQMTDTVPSVDQMMKDLVDEVTEETDGTAPARARESTEKAAEEPGDTSGLRQRARKVIEGNES